MRSSTEPLVRILGGRRLGSWVAPSADDSCLVAQCLPTPDENTLPTIYARFGTKNEHSGKFTETRLLRHNPEAWVTSVMLAANRAGRASAL
jgi:hypothetical protein